MLSQFKTLINASNLHVGGSIQVAVSFIYELSKDSTRARYLSVLASSEVMKGLESVSCNFEKFASFEVLDIHGIQLFRKNSARILDQYSVVFTVIGPLYRWNVPFKSIVGFAQPWIIYPQNNCLSRMSLISRFRSRFTYFVKGLFFRRASELVVELEHVKEGVIRVLGFDPERIHVIYNCLSSIYSDESSWKSLTVPHVECGIRLGFLGRNYLHKNTTIFPSIVKELEVSYGIKARFFVTFTDDEWAMCTPEFRKICVNVGSLIVSQCPIFYQSVDAVVFPSLLECFSATPLEAMAMGKPLFVSDRRFNRDICHEHAYYFDPLQPESAARVIAKVFAKDGPDKEALQAAREHAFNFSSAKVRAQMYMSLLDQ